MNAWTACDLTSSHQNLPTECEIESIKLSIESEIDIHSSLNLNNVSFMNYQDAHIAVLESHCSNYRIESNRIESNRPPLSHFFHCYTFLYANKIKKTPTPTMIYLAPQDLCLCWRKDSDTDAYSCKSVLSSNQLVCYYTRVSNNPQSRIVVPFVIAFVLL